MNQISELSFRSNSSPSGKGRQGQISSPAFAARKFSPARRDCNRLAPVFNRPLSGLAVAVKDEANGERAKSSWVIIRKYGRGAKCLM